MKKREVLVLCVALMVVLSLFFVVAEKVDSSNSKKSENKVKIENLGEGNKIKTRLKSDGGEAESNLEISEDAEGKIKAKLSNGNKQEIKIMPDVASSIAIEGLLSKELKIELIEVGTGANKRLVYVSEANKTGRLFGILKIKMKKIAEIDPVTGEITIVRKKWWAFLVSGEDKDETNDEKMIVCHIPKGNPANKHAISIGKSALKAHLAHGDFIGDCAKGNQTGGGGNQTNQTTGNLSLIIQSPENNRTYNTSLILVDIVSNGNLITYFINNLAYETYNQSFTYNFSEGSNSLVAKAKDAFNNSLEKSISFSVNLTVEIPQNQTSGNQNQTSNSTNSSI